MYPRISPCDRFSLTFSFPTTTALANPSKSHKPSTFMHIPARSLRLPGNSRHSDIHSFAEKFSLNTRKFKHFRTLLHETTGGGVPHRRSPFRPNIDGRTPDRNSVALQQTQLQLREPSISIGRTHPVGTGSSQAAARNWHRQDWQIFAEFRFKRNATEDFRC